MLILFDVIYCWEFFVQVFAASYATFWKLFQFAVKLNLSLLTVVLLGCAASRPVIGWRLCPSNCTHITDGYCVSQLLCLRCLTLLSPTLPTTTGPIYRHCQAGMEWSDVVDCALKLWSVNGSNFAGPEIGADRNHLSGWTILYCVKSH